MVREYRDKRKKRKEWCSMKKVMLIVLALFVAPAMAGVTIEMVQTGDLTVDLVYTVDGDQADGLGGSKVAGLAIDVSVDPGVIIETVTPAKIGVSELGDEGYGIFMSTIDIIDGVIQPSSPAAIGAPDYPGQPGIDSSCVLEFGALWDQRPPEAEKTPPLTSGVLCTIVVSDACTMTLGGNATRGKAVMLGGASIADADIEYIGGPITGPSDDYPWDDREEWEAVGKPESWKRMYQPCGDADGLLEKVGFIPFPAPGIDVMSPVGPADIGKLLDAYRVEVGGADEDLACDFNHAAEKVGFIPFPAPGRDVMSRVGPADIAVLLDWYRTEVDSMPAACRPLAD
jgi:hypothetical protein